MARPSRLKINFDYDSLQNHYQEYFNHLEVLYKNAKSDYQRVIDFMDNPTAVQGLDQARNNALKSINDFMGRRMELLKLHHEIVKGIMKEKGDADGDKGDTGILSKEIRLQMQSHLNDLKKIQKAVPVAQIGPSNAVTVQAKRDAGAEDDFDDYDEYEKSMNR